jgi:hypothetical protein
MRETTLVRAIHDHWIMSGVELPTADSMADELADHLAAAAADGKSVDSVVGPNIRAFADQWAEPYTADEGIGPTLGLVILGAVGFLIFNLGATALFEWAPQVTVHPISTGVGAVLGGLVGLLILSPMSSRLSPGGGVRSWFTLWAGTSLLAGIFLSSWFWLSSRFEESWTFEMPSWLIAAAAFAFVLVLYGSPRENRVRTPGSQGSERPGHDR